MSDLTYFAKATTPVATNFDQVYAGESDIVTTQGRLNIDGAGYVALQVLGRITATGLFKKFDPAASDGSEKAVAILAYDVPATVDPLKYQAIFTGGVFNMNRLVWPAASNTRLERETAFDGSNILAQKLYGDADPT